jgi:transposase
MTRTLPTSPAEAISLIHERVDDIPVLIELARRLHLPEILERHLGTHGQQQGLGNGWMATVWLSFILSQSDHTKYRVEPWVEQRHHTLRSLIGQEFAFSDFNDDRLGVVLRRLGQAQAWEGIEEELWKSTVAVYKLQPEAVWLDTTTASGHHEPQDGGLMQLGHSKDHRPDLAQLKLMAAVAQPSGQLMTSSVHPGNTADDLLYTPTIKRVRRILSRPGMLYVGDSKMSALSTRAELAQARDKYLVPLPHKGKNAELLPEWVERGLVSETLSEVFGEQGQSLGKGYELQRKLSVKRDGRLLSWTERVVVFRSEAFATAAAEALDKRIAKAREQLMALTPAPGRGRRQFQEEPSLLLAIDEVLRRHGLEELLDVHWERRPEPLGGAKTTARYQISSIVPRQERVEEHKARLGWRAYVTNAPQGELSLPQAVVLYRHGWSGERDFHLLKDLPLGISPLQVRNDDQIVGLTCLLTIALRLLTLIQIQVRESLEREGRKLAGLYEGNPGRATDNPTGLRLLRAIARAQVTLTRVELPDRAFLHLTPLPPLLQQILQLLGLPSSIYERLIDSS